MGPAAPGVVTVDEFEGVRKHLPAGAAGPPRQLWLEEHVDPDAQWWGPTLVVEPRYVPAILAGAAENGLLVGTGHANGQTAPQNPVL
jgi:hypothetical protein